jgi:hypothetical protein
MNLSVNEKSKKADLIAFAEEKGIDISGASNNAQRYELIVASFSENLPKNDALEEGEAKTEEPSVPENEKIQKKSKGAFTTWREKKQTSSTRTEENQPVVGEQPLMPIVAENTAVNSAPSELDLFAEKLGFKKVKLSDAISFIEKSKYASKFAVDSEKQIITIKSKKQTVYIHCL